MIEHLTTETFKEKVFDYENNNEWKYNGSVPCIVDFYADWCVPCKTISPILEELSNEYEGKLVIYKVNVDEQQELSYVFGIRSIPSLLFIPLSEEPQFLKGSVPKETFKKIITEFLKIE